MLYNRKVTFYRKPSFNFIEKLSEVRIILHSLLIHSFNTNLFLSEKLKLRSAESNNNNNSKKKIK